MSKRKAVVWTFLLTMLGWLLVMNFRSESAIMSQAIAADYRTGDPQFLRSAGGLLNASMVTGNRVESLVNGESLDAMLAAIGEAKESITFETYIFWSGEVGTRFVDRFIDRARAGVRVHLLLDWVGSADLDASSIDDMEAAGVEVYRYHAPAWYTIDDLNHRTHRKILVVDGRVGFIGGVGVADHWQGDAESPDEWRDSHFRLEGPVVADLQAVFLQNWLELGAPVLHGDPYFPDLATVGTSIAQVIASSADSRAETVRISYLLSLAAAERRVLIANAYFVPDAIAVDALVDAKRRGVDVEIIVPGHITDVEIVRQASRASWGPLLEAGIEIYEYQPTMYHCKVMVVDDAWVLVGSANFDDRSFSLNDEANVNVWDPEFAREQASLFERDKRRSKRVTLEEWRNRPIREKVADYIASWLGSQL